MITEREWEELQALIESLGLSAEQVYEAIRNYHQKVQSHAPYISLPPSPQLGFLF